MYLKLSRSASAVAIVLAVLPAPAAAQFAPRYGSVFDGSAVEKLAEGVYAFVAPDSRTAYFNSNTLVVVGEDGVLVVDSGDALSATRKSIAEIRRLTALPVRYLVNTHWHWDHALGNGEYRAAFPGVTIISTAATRELMDTKGRANLADSIAAIPPYLDSLRQALTSGTRRDGTPLGPGDRESFQAQLDDLGRGLQFYRDARVELPDVTFERELTIRLGARAVKVLAFGGGNTAGDAVLYVPDAKVVATGDLVVAPTPFAYDSFILEWPASMRRLMALDAAIIVPGHGPVMRDWAYARMVTDLLEAIGAQVRSAVARGLGPEDTRKAVDVSALRARMIGADPILARNFDQFFLAPAIDAACKEAQRGPLPGKDRPPPLPGPEPPASSR
jgi:glyoxylase-like metal-dependent hydrolase (beta-lactamase superfamily II)